MILVVLVCICSIMLVKSVGVVAISDNKVLLVQHTDEADHLTGTYGLPSGRVEPNEAEIDAAHREFTEETGLHVDARDLAEFPNNYFEASIPRKDGSLMDFGWRVFRANKFEGEIKESEETIPEWIEIDMLYALEDENKLLPNTIEAVRAAIAE